MSQSIYRPTRTRLLSGLAAALLISGCASTPEAPPPAAATPVPAVPAPARAATAPAAAPVATATVAPAARLNPRHPDRYVVQKGDTLWDISAMFLQDPWFWPEIWYANPQVRNPHLIFPGDILTLVYMDGRPMIMLERGVGDRERLEPQVRVEQLEDAIFTIPYDRISAFLSRPAVIDRQTADRAPYILTSRRGHLVHGAHTQVYVRGGKFSAADEFTVMNIGAELRDPDNGRVLGYRALYVGEGQIVRTGDPATLHLTATAREALNGDRLFPIEKDFPLRFIPRAPDREIEGRIIDIQDGVARAGAFQIVTLNRGASHGLEPGHVLSVWQAGERVSDRFGGGRVDLPDEYAGYLMIFRVFNDISFGLIMQTTNEVSVLDRVRKP
jgi:hypothetical protein